MRLPKNKTEVLNALKSIATNEEEGWADYERLFALSLAYIIGDICPDDRTTKQVFRDREPPKEGV